MERGICLILSNIDFCTADLIRKGGEKDEELLQQTFANLGFKVITKRNKTSAQMLSSIYKVVLNETKKEHTSFAMCLLSHGDAPFRIMGVDGSSLNIWTDMLPAINRQHCQQLAHKPKLIFVQACQGSARISSNSVRQQQMEFDSSNERSHSTTSESQFVNVLMMVAAPPYHVSLRHPKLGSPFVNIFCTMLVRYCATKDLEEIFKLINQEAIKTDYTMIIKENHVHRQSEVVKVQPTLLSTLTQKFYLYPQRANCDMQNKDSNSLQLCDSSDETMIFSHKIEVCYASNGHIVLAALEDKCARQCNQFQFILFIRKNDSCWLKRRVQLILNEVDDCHDGRHFTAKLVALLPENALFHATNLDTGLSNVYMISWTMQQLTTDCDDTMMKARVSSSYCRLHVDGVLHFDCNKALLWAPCRHNGLINYFDVPRLETKVEWRHSAIRGPCMISTSQTTLAVLDAALQNIVVVRRDAASGYAVLFRVPNVQAETINSIALMSDEKLLVNETPSNRITLCWRSSSCGDIAKREIENGELNSASSLLVHLLQVHTYESAETTLIRITKEVVERVDKLSCTCIVYWAKHLLSENTTLKCLPMDSIEKELIDSKQTAFSVTNRTKEKSMSAE